MSNKQVEEPVTYARKRRTKRVEVIASVVASKSCIEPNERSSMKSLEFGKDLEEAVEKLQVRWLNKSPRSTCSNAKRKGKEVHQEKKNNITMEFIDFFAQKDQNKGITICDQRAKTSIDHSSDQKLECQDMYNLYQVSVNYFCCNSMKEMSVWPRYHHKPRIIVHPSKIVGPSTLSQCYDQYMQRRTSVPTPSNFSLMKLLMGDETLTDEELIYANELLSTDQDLSSQGQRGQQWPRSQVGSYQGMQGISGSTTSNFSFMKLLMEDEDSAILTEEQLLPTQLSLSSEGQRMQQRPNSHVGNYQFENSVQQIDLQSCQSQVLQQPQQMSYMDLLTRDDISYMDLLRREDIS